MPMVAGLFALFLLLFVMQFLRGTDVLLGSAITPKDFGRLLLYLAPHFLVMAIPISFLLALLLGFGRLHEDRELVFIESLGFSPVRLLKIPLAMGACLGAVMLLLTFTAEPRGLRAVKELVNQMIKKNVIGDVKAGVFYEDLSQFTVYVQEVDKKNHTWKHVLVHDDRDPSAPLLVLSSGGRVSSGTETETLVLTLLEGVVHLSKQAGGDYSLVAFTQGDLDVGVGDTLFQKNRFRSPKEELTPPQLLQAAEEARTHGEDSVAFRVAFHQRLGQALAPIAFALVGTAVALGSRSSGRARSVVLTLAAYVLYYAMVRFFENLGIRSWVSPFWAGQLPNYLFAASASARLFKRTFGSP